jgi:hypothetical protein
MLHYGFNRFETAKKKSENRNDRRTVAGKGREKENNLKNVPENGKEETEKETEEK